MKLSDMTPPIDILRIAYVAWREATDFTEIQERLVDLQKALLLRDELEKGDEHA